MTPPRKIQRSCSKNIKPTSLEQKINGSGGWNYLIIPSKTVRRWRLKTKAQACSYGAEDKDEQITLQLIKGLKWAEARRKLLGKGNNLKLEAAIKIALVYQATTNHTLCFKQKSIDAVKRHNCLRCGSNHPPRKCPAYGKECTKSGRPSHFTIKCQT